MKDLTLKALKQLSSLTKRNVIVYYATEPVGESDYEHKINEYDMDSLRRCVYRMQRGRGLDLILHVKGGIQEVAEKIVTYLAHEFVDKNGYPDVRVIIPSEVAQAGTIIACGAKEILMHTDAILGGIEPQIGKYPAKYINAVYQATKEQILLSPEKAGEIAKRNNRKKHPGGLQEAVLKLDLADAILRNVLTTAMLGEQKKSEKDIIENIINTLNEKNDPTSFPGSFTLADCKAMGLKVKDLKEETVLQTEANLNTNADRKKSQRAEFEKRVMAVYDALVQEYEQEAADSDKTGKVIANHFGVEAVQSETKSVSPAERRNLIKDLETLTGRNVLVYYSDFHKQKETTEIGVREGDAEILKDLLAIIDPEKGLDVLIHTPGGNAAEAKKIIALLREKSNGDLRVIVPQMAMSAGTMIACAANEIFMGMQSNLGPADIQYDIIGNVAGLDLIKEIEHGLREVEKKPETEAYWRQIFARYTEYIGRFLKGVGAHDFITTRFTRSKSSEWKKLISKLKDSLELKQEKLKEEEKAFLGTGMFDQGNPEHKTLIDHIVETLNDREALKTHGRRLNSEFCRNLGLKINMLEDKDNREMQSLVMKLHNNYMNAFRKEGVARVMETREDGKIIDIDYISAPNKQN